MSNSLLSAKVVKVIELVPSVCPFVWVCSTSGVHHCNGSELCCAPSACVVHLWPALCTIVHKGHLFSGELGVTPNIYVMDHQLDGAQCDVVSQCAFSWPSGLIKPLTRTKGLRKAWCRTCINTGAFSFFNNIRYLGVMQHTGGLYQSRLLNI